MNEYHIAEALKILILAVLPLMSAVFGGAVVGGLIVTLLRIEDRSIGFLCRVAAFALAIYFVTDTITARAVEFGKTMWTDTKNYH